MICACPFAPPGVSTGVNWRGIGPIGCRDNNVRHHPIYAGAYRGGSRQVDPRQQQPGRPNTGRPVTPLESCEGLITERFPPDISWERLASIPQRVANNRRIAHAQGAPREGPAFLGGVLVCGRCGRRLLPAYRGQGNRRRSTCMRATIDDGAPGCLSRSGVFLDDFVVEQRRAVLKPASVAWSIAAAQAVRAERAPRETHWPQR